MVLPAAIPSPPSAVWQLGPLPLRAYALALIAGIVAGTYIAKGRYETRTTGGTFDDVMDIIFWAVPLGIIGSRLYHVFTSPAAYFGPYGDPARIVRIWEGGLGVWGAIAAGALGVVIACRRRRLRVSTFLDAVAPGLLVAQAIGRLGNWFNQELFGGPTTLPWGLQIDPAHLPLEAATGVAYPAGTLFHPTFLYEMLWNLAMAALLIYLDRRLRLGHGQVFALYVFLYCLGRGFIETLRVDPATIIAGQRLNVWTSLLLGLGGLAVFFWLRRKYPTRELDARVDYDGLPNVALTAPVQEIVAA